MTARICRQESSTPHVSDFHVTKWIGEQCVSDESICRVHASSFLGNVLVALHFTGGRIEIIRNEDA